MSELISAANNIFLGGGGIIAIFLGAIGLIDVFVGGTANVAIVADNAIRVLLSS